MTEKLPSFRVQIVCTDGEMFAKRIVAADFHQAYIRVGQWLVEGVEFTAFGRTRMTKAQDVCEIAIKEWV